MASLRDIKRRISSVQSTQKITRAMKMVAAAKLRRAQEAILRTRPYAYRMRDLANSLALRTERDAHPLLKSGGMGEKVGIIVITSDRGLCGGFNANIVNGLMRAIAAQFEGKEVEITVVGKKGIELLRRRSCTVRGSYTQVHDGSVMDTAGQIIDDVVAEFMKGETAEVYCLYNEFKSAISQKVTLEKLLPFEPQSDDGQVTIDYLYEPTSEEVFDQLLARHMQVQMHRILNESAASEYGARMTAMDAATQNAGDVIGRLTLQYNRARQDAITKELIEVVSGAEAL